MLLQLHIPEYDSIESTPDKSRYHFKKNWLQHLVCDVEDQSHLAWFLGRPEFTPYDQEDAAEAARQVAKAKAAEAADVDEDDEDGYFDEAGAPPPGLNADGSNAEAEKDEDPYLNATLEELQAAYKDRFGKASHPSTKHETLLAKLREYDARKAAEAKAYKRAEAGATE